MPTNPPNAVNLAQIATRLAEQRAFWEPMIVFDPAERYYTRLAREPEFEVWLLTWLPGQGTEWHDHGRSAGAFVTVRGTLTEQYAMVGPDDPPRIVPRTRGWSPARSAPSAGGTCTRWPTSVPSRRSACTFKVPLWSR